jgi:hypothetical protein
LQCIPLNLDAIDLIVATALELICVDARKVSERDAVRSIDKALEFCEYEALFLENFLHFF